MSDDKYQNNRFIDKVAMFMIGIINNTPYVIGIASAQRIVKNYNVDKYLGIVLWANTISGIFSRFLNSLVVSLNVPYEVNFVANLIMMLFGLLACAFSKVFWFTCIGVFFIGFSSNLGESVILCYMTYRRKQGLLKSWGSGTGMAGIAGAGYSFICDIVNISLFWSFIGVSPVVILYGVLFFGIIWRSPESDDPAAHQNKSLNCSTIQDSANKIKNPNKKSFFSNFKKDKADDTEITQPILDNQIDGNNDQNYTFSPNQNNEQEDPIGSVTNTQNIPDQPQNDDCDDEKVGVCDCTYFHSAWGLIFNCGMVYFLEYCIQGVFADCCLPGEEQKKYHYMFSLLNLCYQFGVFISRSSLSCFHFRHIWILTVAQCGFFTFWCLQAFYHFTPFYGLLPIMVCVGLFGGCSYVNAFDLMMNDPTKTTKQKEMVTSWNSFFISLFIVLSTAFTFVAELTFLIPPSTE
ncbi:hypothetical protein M9Y10_010435 [Tritrichomonas musculus]|uniref:CLN3 protein n=1 Tax=Tritrichomonas musculus TaxID=1915356 RepID=A0ABR2ILX0_9EUKA